MGFEAEPMGYAKTALSDLQGSWGNLRRAVVVKFACSLTGKDSINLKSV